MQLQQEREPDIKPVMPRSSKGEIFTAWLFVLFGTAWVVIVPLYIQPWLPWSEDKIINLLRVLNCGHGFFWLLWGLRILLSARRDTKE